MGPKKKYKEVNIRQLVDDTLSMRNFFVCSRKNSFDTDLLT